MAEAAERSNTAAQDALKAQVPQGSLASQMPQELGIERAGFGFTLPGERDLNDDWQELQTTSSTRVRCSFTSDEVRISFSPALRIDACWPFSDVAWSSVTWDLAQGCVKDVYTRNSQGFAFGAKGSARDEITETINGMMKGTPLGRAGYDPLRDEDLSGTIAALERAFTQGEAMGGEADVAPKEVEGLNVFGDLQVREQIEKHGGEGRIVIDEGKAIHVGAAIDGNMAELAEQGPRSIRSVYIKSEDAITVFRGDRPVAHIKEMVVSNGGQVQVKRIKPLGRLEEAEGVEQGIEALLVLFTVAAALDSGRHPGTMRVGGAIVEGQSSFSKHAMEEISTALTEAADEIILDNRDFLPGIDLAELMGVPERAEGAAQAAK